MSRERQIQSIIQFNPNAYPESACVWVIQRPQFVLRVELPPSFPHVAPILTLNPPVRHQWVALDSGKVVNHMGIRNWNINIQLGSLISEILAGLANAPPAAPLRPVTPSPVQYTPQSHVPPSSLVPQLPYHVASDPERLQRAIAELPEFAEERAVVDSLESATSQATASLASLKSEAEKLTEEYNNLLDRKSEDGPTLSYVAAQQLLEDRKSEQDAISASLVAGENLLGMKSVFIEAREKYHNVCAKLERIKYQQMKSL